MAALGARGAWKKLKIVGKGSFGQVFLVQRNNSDVRKFVMKEVTLRGLPRAEMLSAQNEVTVLKKLTHPHIIAIEEALVVDDVLCSGSCGCGSHGLLTSFFYCEICDVA